MNPGTLSAFCERQLPATLDLLREMVAINSFTENAAGVNRLGDFTAAAFAPLGFKAAFHPASHPAYGRHLILHRAAAAGAPTIALVSHLDTVFTAEEEARHGFAWRQEGHRIYGPGTNDIKGGTALIHLVLSALRSEAPALFERTNWFILLNACEEVISTDFAALCRTHLPADTRACLVFEADGGEAGDFSLVAARKGRATFTVEVEGRAAHAGSDHARGANAIVQLARLIDPLTALTDPAAGVTVNVGTILGGTVLNRVPHAARAGLEMRAFSPDAFERAKRAILALQNAPRLPGCTIAIRVEDQTRPWPPNPATERLLGHWQQTGADLRLRVQREERGGLSDGNVIWDSYPTLDGLGPRGDHSHCSEHTPDGTKTQEWVDAESFVPKATLNTLAIARLLTPPAPPLVGS